MVLRCRVKSVSFILMKMKSLILPFNNRWRIMDHRSCQMMIAQLDQASLEELVRLSNLVPNGEEMILDTRLVFDWRFSGTRVATRARWVAREFRSGDASNEQTFSPMSSKWIIHVLLVLALVQQLSGMLVTDVKDAFLTVPQRDFVLVGIPAWAKTDEMGMATACIKTRSNVCTSQFT